MLNGQSVPQNLILLKSSLHHLGNQGCEITGNKKLSDVWKPTTNCSSSSKNNNSQHLENIKKNQLDNFVEFVRETAI